MRKNVTEIVFILDRSGSMSGLEADTIGGFNAMLEQQKRSDGEALVSAVLFDDESRVLYDRVNIREIPRMTDRDYTVRGSTALLDAVGGAIHHIGVVHKYARAEDVPEHTHEAFGSNCALSLCITHLATFHLLGRLRMRLLVSSSNSFVRCSNGCYDCSYYAPTQTHPSQRLPKHNRCENPRLQSYRF